MAPLAADSASSDINHAMSLERAARGLTPAEKLMQSLEDGAPNGGGGSLDFEHPAVLGAVSKIEQYGLEREATGRLTATKHAAEVKRVQLVANFIAMWKAMNITKDQAEVIQCSNMELQAIYVTLRKAGYNETGFLGNGEVAS